MNELSLSVVIACHNEAGALAPVLAGVRQNVPGAEVIVVDDGSTDETAAIAGGVVDVRLIRLPTNHGKGVALRTGIHAATGDTLVFIDGDGQDDPNDLPILLAAARDGHSFVNGSKFIGAIEPGGISRPNYFGNKFMNALINLLFGTHVTDSQSGFRVIAKNLAEAMHLEATQYEIETEMLCQAVKHGAGIVEVPVTRRSRTAGATGFRRVKNGLRILWTILKQRFTPGSPRPCASRS